MCSTTSTFVSNKTQCEYQSDQSFILKDSKSTPTLNVDPPVHSSHLMSEFHSALDKLIIFKMQPVEPVFVK